MSDVTPLPVRTAEEPMAFTSDELLRGGITAWIVFMALLVCGEAVHLALLFPSAAIESVPAGFLRLVFFLLLIALAGGMVAAVVVPFGVLIMLPIALALRRVGSIGVHVTLYALVGAAVGGAYFFAFNGGHPLYPMTPWDYFAVIPAISAAFAIPLAWWWTARRALRIDAGLITPRPRRQDRDAEHEDRVTATGRGDVSGES